ncbi:FtsK/SpoIIIE domain-containing protein [Arthrobacter sp. fls2-241-R2A-200]|uniref:FtsK/SpoIIIE domain-containing protein n=1 Tax=Arthrobacter sp. fls2-241-R2A-200 TaxID=3040281 RepID=UPI00254AB87C|nr:FtsK/SpoIIIE domain-containing protein [Arthrobacter sp. fls2-241-R2A-200]
MSISVPDGTPGTDVQSLLKEARGSGRIYVAGEDISLLTVGRPPLVAGAVLVDGFVPGHENSPKSSPLLLLVHSGPAAGMVFPLYRGRYRVGRGIGNITVPDPRMSREHAVIDVSSTSVTITRRDKSTPLLVNGQPAGQARLTPETTFQCGSTLFSVITDNGPTPGLPKEAGQSVETPIEVAHAPASRNVLAVTLAAGMPLVMGIGLAVVSGMWLYLGLSAMSAASLLIPMFSGLKSRREFKAALAEGVKDDTQRRRRTAPSAADILVALHSERGRWKAGSAMPAQRGRGTTANQSRALRGSVAQESAVWVRLGVRHAQANVCLVPGVRHFQAPTIGSAALTLDPRLPLVILRGRSEHVDAMIRFIVMQLVSFQASALSPIILLGPVDRLPLPARFLPGTYLAASPSAALATLHRLRNGESGHLILFDDASLEDNQGLATLLDSAHLAKWRVIRGGSPSSSDVQSAEGPAVIEISTSGISATLDAGGHHQAFIPDLLPGEVFDGFCRISGLTSQVPSPAEDGIPRRCSLVELRSYGQRSILRRWDAVGLQKRLQAVLGWGIEGHMDFDFGLDGPHLLVAGTTGSGKSELLRSLVVSLALNHPPEHVTFLFFDFKGGSGLRPLTGLPHCLGLLTDLSEHQLDRALVSLRAEIRYREERFQAVGASDLSAYQQARVPSNESIPHLFVVIDEFRMLVDEAPGALRELMRVATVGRSLGIHLVMATQRPQGALTADIRANVTSSIALRVQTEMESVDIINAKSAAFISVETPGRAYLARASSSPVEFQTASLAAQIGDETPLNPLTSGEPAVKSAVESLEQPRQQSRGPAEEEMLPDSGTYAAVSAIKEAWGRLGRADARRPVPPPLPASVEWHETVKWDDTVEWGGVLDGQPRRLGNVVEPNGSWVVGPLGLLDLPKRQRVEPLLWSPRGHGHLAMIGGASSGMQACFMAAAAMVATQEPKPHLYILDATGMAAGSDLPANRSVAGLHQMPLAARILTLLSAEMDRRRTVAHASQNTAPLVLIIAGWCSWVSALRGGPFASAESTVHDIIRDGISLGITVLISGERELVSARFMGLISNRAYFPLGSSEESRYHWPRLPSVESIPGRAVVFGGLAPEQGAVAQFRASPEEGPWPYGSTTSTNPPFRVRPIPEFLTVEDFRERFKETTQQEGAIPPLWIGVGGDECLPVALPLPESGVSVILGPRGSGKTSILETLRVLNPRQTWVFPGHGTPLSAFWIQAAEASEAGLLDPQGVLLVDDADLLDLGGQRAITALAGNVRGIVMAASSGPTVLRQLPLAREVQGSGTGIVLTPKSAFDGDPLGVRLIVDDPAPRGRGFLIEAAAATPFQAALAASSPDGSRLSR